LGSEYNPLGLNDPFCSESICVKRPPGDLSVSDLFWKLVAHSQAIMVRLGIPGIAIGLSVGRREFVAALGVISLADPRSATPETIYQIGSITKTFTATAIFRLIEQGKAGLDDPVRKYIPSFKVQDEYTAARVTIRHLLNHTAGWMGDFFINTGEGDEALAKYVELMAGLPQLTPLGATYAYNNASFNVAGRIIEIIAGKPYENVIREMLLDPLEMSASAFFPAEALGHPIATGYAQKDDRTTEPIGWFVNRGEAPCGGLALNVVDLLRYARFHINDDKTVHGEHLLSRLFLKQMQTPTVPADKQAWMGLNWFINDTSGVRVIYHNGSTNGQESALWMVPEEGLALVVLTNHFKGNLLHEDLTLWLRNLFLKGRLSTKEGRKKIEEKGERG
jgi:CubicO group peptidase (beta-lactamase class C family)